MARLNIYLPDELAEEARAAGLNLSAVTQAALRQTLAARSTDEWLARLARRPVATHNVDHDAALAALDAARDEATTHHG